MLKPIRWIVVRLLLLSLVGIPLHTRAFRNIAFATKALTNKHNPNHAFGIISSLGVKKELPRSLTICFQQLKGDNNNKVLKPASLGQSTKTKSSLKYYNGLDEVDISALLEEVVEEDEDEDMYGLYIGGDGSLSQKAMIANTFELFLWVLPFLVGVGSFLSYDAIESAFHTLSEYANENAIASGAPVLGDFDFDQLVRAVNGPLTTSLAIMFGTLTGVTVSNLYARQSSIQKIILMLEEELAYLYLLIESFPERYRTRARNYLGNTITAMLQGIQRGDGIQCEKVLEKRKLSIDFIRLLDTILMDTENSTPMLIVDKTYGSVQSIIQKRAELQGYVQMSFPPIHYGVLLSTAFALSTIFVIHTDCAQLEYQMRFPVHLCWGMMQWVFTMLAVVIYDLATPFTGAFRVSSCGGLDDYLEDLREEANSPSTRKGNAA